MQRHTLLTLCAAAVFATSALGLATARPAKPASLIASMAWEGDVDRDWNVGGNWTGGVVPAAGDIVTIPSEVGVPYKGNPVISNAHAFAGHLTIESSLRTVTVTGKTLTLNSAVTHDFDGDLILTNGSAKLVFTADATINGGAKIVGQHNDAQVLIDEPSSGTNTLTSNIIFEGNMTVARGVDAAGTATFLNGSTGVVRADVDGGILTFAADLDITDGGSCSSAVWAAIGFSGFTTQPVLKFEESATGLTSKFRLDHCATIQLAAGVNVTTTNTLKDEAGTAIAQGYVKTGGTFEYRDNCPSGSQNMLSAACTLIGSECNDC